MANRPVNTGSDAAAVPPPVHHDAAPAGHRAARTTRTTRTTRAARDPRPSMLAWLPYLIVLAGAATGMFVVWMGSKYAGRGAGPAHPAGALRGPAGDPPKSFRRARLRGVRRRGARRRHSAAISSTFMKGTG